MLQKEYIVLWRIKGIDEELISSYNHNRYRKAMEQVGEGLAVLERKEKKTKKNKALNFSANKLKGQRFPLALMGG